MLGSVDYYPYIYSIIKNKEIMANNKTSVFHELYDIKVIETNEIQKWSLGDILDEINRDRSGSWTHYDETDWLEGWNEWIEGEFYSLILK